MAVLTTTAISGIWNFFKDSIAYARYRIGTTYYRAEIQSAEISTDGYISITFLIDHTGTINRVQLCDQNGQAWATRTEKITRISTDEGLLYLFRFTITEG